jgi:tetratricopeptide (TPR) repeat protein
MADVQSALAQAISRHQAGDVDAAERAYREILAAQPAHADALHLLGLVLHQKGDPAGAVDHIRRAIEAAPKTVMYHANLGRVLMSRDLAEEAVDAYREAVSLSPDDAVLHSDMAAALVAAGECDAARARARLALELDENLAAAHLNLGLALQALGGVAAEDAEASFRRAADLAPDLADAHQALGQLHQARGEDDAAMERYRLAVHAQPGMAEAHCNLGNILRERFDLPAALVQYDAALTTSPDVAALHANKAVALHEMGRFEEALAGYDKALQLDPEDAECQRNRAMTLLLLGRFDEGWHAYEARWRTARFRQELRGSTKPRWTGGATDPGATVLVRAEQGYGDTIQFARYVDLIAARGLHAAVECPSPLVRLMRSLAGVTQVVEQGAPLPGHDVQIPMMSLPGAFKTDLDSVPADIPYLHPPKDLMDSWRRRLEHLAGVRIGLAWKGSANHPRDRVRSPGLAPLLELLKLPGASFLSLQKDGGDKDIAAHGAAIEDFTNDLSDFAETAALIANLDLVVTCDTAVGHLAGALGRPVTMLLPHVPEWRWLLGRDDTPWYPTMRLIRQASPGDWAGAVAETSQYIRRHWL